MGIKKIVHSSLKMTLKRRLFIYITLITVTALFFVVFFSFVIFYRVIIDRIGNSRVDVLKQIAERTSAVKSSAMTVSNLIYFDGRLEDAIYEKNIDAEKTKLTIENLNATCSLYKEVFEQIDMTFYVVIMSNNGFRYNSISNDYSYSATEKSFWYYKMMQSPNDVFWVGGVNDALNDNPDHYVFTFARTFHKPGEKNSYAALLVNIDESYISNTYKSVEVNNNVFYILDEKGGVISHSDKHLIGLNFYNMELFQTRVGDNTNIIIKKNNSRVLLTHYFDYSTGWTIKVPPIVKTLFWE